MSLLTLPEEVLETLFLYLGVQDLLAIWDVVRLPGRDSFWKRICNRQNYIRIPNEDECWKEVFSRNISWICGKFAKRQFAFETIVSNQNNGNFYGEFILQGKNLIVKSKDNELVIWSLNKKPVLIEKLPFKYFISSKSRLLAYSESQSNIYSWNTDSYDNCGTLPWSPFGCDCTQYSLSDNHLVLLDKRSNSLRIFDLQNMKCFELPISNNKIKPFLVVDSSESVVNIMVLDGSDYKLRRYDIKKHNWLDDILLFGGGSLIDVPNVVFSSPIVVSWSNLLLSQSVTPIKVWNYKGELLKVLTFEFLTSFGIYDQTVGEQILWLVVEGDYLILSTCATSITIWNSKESQVCKQISKSEHFYNGQKVISNTLIVLSYKHCFKVVDFQKALYLYNVSFGNEQSDGSLSWFARPFYVNEYFYIHFNEFNNFNTPNAIKKAENDVRFNTAPTDGRNKSNQVTQRNKDYFLTIYDFRGNNYMI